MPWVVVLSLPFLVVLATRPVLRRLALRNAARRPRETALVLLGSLLGTAIITGSLVVGDTLDSSFRRAAWSHQGPIDELVETQAVSNDVVFERLAAARSKDVDGLLRMTSVAVSAMTLGSLRKAEPHAHVVEVDFAQARAFGDDPDTTGVSGPTPLPGHAAVTKDLARTLDVGAGDRIAVSAYGRRVELTVDRVLPRRGIAGFRLDPTSEAPNVVVGPGTVAGLAGGAPPGASPPHSYVAVSNRGGVLDGAALSSGVEQQVRAALGDLPAHIHLLKQDTIDNATDAGKQFTELFAGIGFFSVLAGILLLVNIFVMLAQERKTELGMLRAVGLRRAGLVGAFSLEGWLYALASSVLGMVAGLGLGRLIVAVAAGIFSRPGDEFSLELRYSARMASVVDGFAIGFVISLLTVVVTSLVIARVNIIRAIRDVPEPPRSRRSNVVLDVAGTGLAVVGAWMFAVGVASSAPALVLVGPALFAVGVVRLLRRFVPGRPLRTGAAAFVLVLSIAGFDLFGKAFEDAQIPVFVVLGVILTAAAVSLTTVNQEAIGRAVRRVSAGGDGGSMSLRLGLAYPLARRFRTGMIVSMYSLVVFTLTFMTVFSHLFAQQIDSFTAKVSGGYDVRVDSNPSNPIGVADVLSVPGVERAAPVSNALAEFQLRCRSCRGAEFEQWPASSVGPEFIDGGPPVLAKRSSSYATDAEAYRALLTDPNVFIPTQFFLQNGAGPPERSATVGDTVAVKDPESGQVRELRVIGIAEAGFGNAMALVPSSVMTALFGARATPNALFVRVRAGASADGVADAINGRFVENGADAGSFRSIVESNLSQQTQFFRLIQGYLALGLLVGIAGLGVVMVRAVRERRREVGVLRALGFEARAVRRAFVAESAFVALEGITIGTVLAIVVSWRLVGNDTFGATLGFSVPVVPLAVLVLGTFAASLLATVTPAQQASRIKPAVALRIAD